MLQILGAAFYIGCAMIFTTFGVLLAVEWIVLDRTRPYGYVVIIGTFYLAALNIAYLLR